MTVRASALFRHEQRKTLTSGETSPSAADVDIGSEGTHLRITVPYHHAFPALAELFPDVKYLLAARRQVEFELS